MSFPDRGRPPRLVVVTIPDCHLCDLAREAVEKMAFRAGIPWSEKDLTETGAPDPAWWDEVPLVLVDDAVVCRLRVDEDLLGAALER
ncbi:glutaredoxin family protein [Austwickia chelonae]|uniref:glutaredoxin family protein n=1 Tax=Austwickia chelonae TaxID=100225 RepID=UPI000E2521EE|nr:glutaredoxin family protein [Austwickia chelonae]